jgi:hypothetical protein
MTHPLSIFSSFHGVHEIRGLVQSVLKNDRVNDLATIGATKTRDADVTSIVLEVQVMLLDHQSPAMNTVASAG